MNRSSKTSSTRAPRTPGAFWPVVALCTIAAGPSVARADEPQPEKVAATKDDMAEARRQFEAGISLLEDPESPRYEEAHNAFKRSYDLSHNPKVLGNIALCAFYLERDGEAVDLYTTYLRDVPNIEDHERRQIERDLATLRATVATVEIRVKGSTERSLLFVDRRIQTRGNTVENAYPFTGDRLVVKMRPGRHSLVVRAPDASAETGSLDVTVQPASSSTHELEFRTSILEAPPVATVHRSVAGPVVFGAFGLVGIGAGIATGLVARGITRDIERRCPNDTCPASYNGFTSDRASGKTFATVADFSFIGGGVLLGGALLWYALLPAKASSSRRSAFVPAGSCAGSGCRVSLQGEF